MHRQQYNTRGWELHRTLKGYNPACVSGTDQIPEEHRSMLSALLFERHFHALGTSRTSTVWQSTSLCIYLTLLDYMLQTRTTKSNVKKKVGPENDRWACLVTV